jgi:hypothetical protein
MKVKQTSWTVVVIANLLGVLIGWVDSRPTWDDTGVTVALVFGISASLGLAIPRRPWIWGLSVGMWIPLWNILLTNNLTAVLALGVAFVGAYGGAFVRKVFSTER